MKNKFNIGDPVYFLEFSQVIGKIYLSYGLITGISSEIRIQYSSITASDLINNIFQLYYDIMSIHKDKESGEFYLLADDRTYNVKAEMCFECREDAQEYLHKIANSFGEDND